MTSRQQHDLPADAALQASIMRMTARDPTFIGWRLTRLREARNQTAEQQAQALGITPAVLAWLSMSKLPRPGDRDIEDDIARIARWIGVSVEQLAAILVEVEQAATCGVDGALVVEQSDPDGGWWCVMSCGLPMGMPRRRSPGVNRSSPAK
jgi:transcriptional regulator with XRE-family HTH domain